MKVKCIEAFNDKTNNFTTVNVGEVLEVSEARAKELVKQEKVIIVKEKV